MAKEHELYIKIAGKIDKSLKNATRAASGEVNSFSKNAQKALKNATIAAAATGTAAVAITAKLGKEVITAYAEYEQLVGGVETMFGDSSDKLMEYANNAYKTAGLSANAYMETVTSFSASLVQSLGGDTEKAVEYANLAITDMSDNANKMGTDISAIQNAYQGFAKQNYTMLDNLKLGYGGTKTEMQRLLSDAEKLSGMKFDLESYSDIVQAIHVVQENMGVAGTTALEAEKTISGSIGMLKASFDNLLVGFGNPQADMEPLVQNVVGSFETVLKNIVPVIENIISALPPAIGSMMGAVSDMLPTLVKTATELFQNVLLALVDMLPNIIPVAVDAIITVVNTLLDNAGQIIECAGELIVALAQGIAEALPELIPAAIDAIFTLIDYLLDNVDILIDAGMKLTQGLIVGIIKAVPKIIQYIPQLIKGIVNALKKGGTLLWESGKGLAEKLWGGVKSNIAQAISDVVSSFENAFPHLSSFLQGLCQSISSVWENIKSIFSNIIDFIKNIFSGNWSGAWENIVNIFGSVFGTLTNLAKAPINGVSSAINTVLEKVNGISINIPDWVPGVGGKSLGFNLPTIPMLAEGGIAKSATLAMVGEGNEPEAIMPLSKLVDLIKNMFGENITNNNVENQNESIVFAPVFNFYGGTSKEEAEEAGRISFAEFKRLYEQLRREERRKDFKPA